MWTESTRTWQYERQTEHSFANIQQLIINTTIVFPPFSQFTAHRSAWVDEISLPLARRDYYARYVTRLAVTTAAAMGCFDCSWTLAPPDPTRDRRSLVQPILRQDCSLLVHNKVTADPLMYRLIPVHLVSCSKADGSMTIILVFHPPTVRSSAVT